MIAELDALRAPLSEINLIEASAGTGKTYTITTLYLRLILEKKLSIEKILVVTFTEAATEELRDRLRRRLQQALVAFQQGSTDDLVLSTLLARHQENEETLKDANERLKMAIRGFDEASIFTIHSFCRQMLRDNAFESGVLFDTELITDSSGLLRSIVEDFWRRHLYDAPMPFIHWLLDHKVTNPQQFLNSLGGGRFIGQRFLSVQPANSTIPNTQTLEHAFKKAWQVAQKAWQSEQVELCKLLAESPDLKHNSYSRANVPKWQAIVTAYFAEAKASHNLPEAMMRFSLDAVQNQVKAGKGFVEPPLLAKIDQLINASTALTETYQHYLLALKVKLFQEADKQLKQKKQLYNVQSFDDLLSNLHTALVHSGGGEQLAATLRHKFKAALIDEFQDTDPLQYEIFYKIYGQADSEQRPPLLFMIGDPKQAIYSFRGADIFAYLHASEHANHRYTLPTNYRSDAPLIRAVNGLFMQQPKPFLFDGIQFNPVSAPAEKPADSGDLQLNGAYPTPLQCWQVTWNEVQSTSDKPLETHNKDGKPKSMPKNWANTYLPKAVGYEIARLLNQAQQGHAHIGERALVAGDIAILVRTNRQAQLMQMALTAQQIPSVIYSHESLFTAAEVVDIERILLAVADPAQERLVKAALTTTLIGLSGTALFQLMNQDRDWQQCLKRFQSYHDIWQKRGFIQMYRALLVTEQVPERLLSYIDGERRLTNVLHAGELLQQTAVTEKLGMTGLCQWFNQQRQQATEDKNNEASQLRLESDDKRVKIITIHKSKGLEYPIVFCPFLWDGNLKTERADQFTFHDTNNNNHLVLDLGSNAQDTHRVQAQLEERAENLRLFYVAVTRAKHRCYLIWGIFKSAETSALAHLLYPNVHPSEFAKLDATQFNQGLAQLQQYTEGQFQYCPIPLAPVIYQRPIDTETELSARQFNGQIDHRWRISSFSALTRQYEHDDRLIDLPDHDEGSHVESSVSTPQTVANFLDFPRGARAGDFLHALLQYLDFSAPLDDSYLNTRLQAFGYVSEQWGGIIKHALHDILHTPLIAGQDSFCLAQIKRNQRLNELEFYYPLGAISAQGLKQHLAPIAQAVGSPIPEQLERLQFSPLQGFMKGYIDLVFRHEGKYYLVDYKSNYLGRNTQAYHHENLTQAMTRHDYFLQYCLYCVALHRYLTLRVPDYDYQQHFGGVFYLFLRGMRPEWGAQFGIFRDRPEAGALARLSDYLARGDRADETKYF